MADLQLINDPLYFEKLRAQENEDKIERERLKFKTMFILYDDSINKKLLNSEKKQTLKDCGSELEMMQEQIKLREDLCADLNSTVQLMTEEAEKYKRMSECQRHNYQELSEELETMQNEERKPDDAVTRDVSKREVELIQENEKLANENLEISELLLQEKRFSVDLDTQLCETQRNLLGLQTDWRKLNYKYKEVKVKLETATGSICSLRTKIQLLSERPEGAGSQEPLVEDVGTAPSPKSPQGSCNQGTNELPGAPVTMKKKMALWKRFT